MGFAHNANHSQLHINSIPLMAPSWRVLNLQVLQSGAQVRGSDVVIPGVAGVKARRRRQTATEHTLEMMILGDVNVSNATYSNAIQGVQSNVNYLRYYVVDPPATTAGTHSATLTLADGTTDTTPVHVTGFEVGDSIGFGKLRATLDISIPAGVFG